MKIKLVISLLIMALTTNLIRILPVTLIRGRIKNRFLRSFLYYVPYVTLAVMTVPAIIDAAGTPLAGLLALFAGILAAWYGRGLFTVATICCVVVLATGWLS